MKELLRTNDLVRLSYLEALLRGEGIELFIMDGHISAVEAGISLFPRRLMVREAEYDAACDLLLDAGEALD
jgi:hypothetical protein